MTPEAELQAAPSSEKSYIGNFPFGTRLRLSEHNVLGIYWRNEWGTRVFDLSFMDCEGEIVSWRGAYWGGRDEAARDVVYSGDMTNADPEATELLYIAGSCPDGLVRVNQFRGESRSRIRFFIFEKIERCRRKTRQRRVPKANIK